MNCELCGESIPDGLRLCESCAVPMHDKPCPLCHEPMQDGDKDVIENVHIGNVHLSCILLHAINKKAT